MSSFLKNYFFDGSFPRIFFVICFIVSIQDLKSEEESLVLDYTEAQKWTLALGNFLVEQNSGDIRFLGGFQKNKESIKRTKSILKDFWGIESKEELLEALSRLKKEGHRAQYQKIQKDLARLGSARLKSSLPEDGDKAGEMNRIDIVENSMAMLGENGVLAWDMGRYVNVVGWSYIAGYISEKEAWRLMAPIARQVQKSFQNWDEYTKSYIAGRSFWSNGRDEKDENKVREIAIRLLEDKNSLFNQLFWDTNLDCLQ